MKILQITPYFYPSNAGIQAHTLNLSHSLSQRGHQVDILTVNTENALKEEVIADTIKVYRCSPIFKYRGFYVSLELARKLLKAKDYDLYHIHIPFPLGLDTAIAASIIHHIPLVVTQHGEGTTAKPGIVYSVLAELLNLYYWFAQTVSLRFASRIIFYTQSYPESLGLGTKIKERIRIVRNGVDSQRFSPRSDGSRLRAKYGFDSTNKVLLFVGALPRSHRYKGVDYLIEAVHIARSKNTTIKLAVVGGGGLVPELNKLVAELELGQNVVFTGAMPNEHLPPYYAMCDIFVLPSVSSPESFGQVLQEAMASGKPCIASDLPGVREVVKNEKTGLLVPPKNPEALAQAILHLAEDDSLRNEMSHNARMEVASYSWQKCAQEMEAIYNEVLGL